MLTAYISTEAFWSITLATIEVFKKECFGYLVGHRLEDRWIVARAVPHQTARRCYTWVEPQARPRRRIEKALRSLASGEEIIGWFHSHPEWGGITFPATLSTGDINFSKKNELILVAAIRASKRHVKWNIHEMLSISGTLGGHHLLLSAFVKRPSGEIEQVRVSCAYAHGFEEREPVSLIPQDNVPF